MAQQLDYDYETLLLQEEESTEGLAFKPILGAGMGTFSFFGDVNNYLRSPLYGLTSYRVSISRNLNKNFDFEFHGSFGEVSGNEYNGSVNNVQNFKTSLFLGGVSLVYNFNHLLKRQRPIHPFIAIGAEILQFTPKGDYLDNNGNPYYYWSDGTIRDVEQGLGVGNIISRDYKYETDLRDLDLYNYGYYPKTSFAIPVDIGVHVTISDRVKCRIGTAVHLAMSDYIDNYKGGGTWKNDIVLNTYISLSFDMFSPADEIVSVENFKNLKFTITDNEDSDGDGVDDFNDECPNTPPNVKVNFKGCPLDIDNDGVPDYMDKQNDTQSGSFAVGANGVKIMENHLIVMLYDPDAVKRSEVKLYKRTTDSKQSDNEVKGIPEKFKQVDVNGDNYISHEELQEAIDAIFEMNSTLTPGDIYELQEFFFNQ
ncbi:MAG: thrombospondin type 3 repeat-containing protein [Salinivirgaceae bacterium]